MGRFGFLSELTPEDCEESLKKVLNGEGCVSERMMLSCSVRRQGKTTFQGLALNDAVMSSGSQSMVVSSPVINNT